MKDIRILAYTRTGRVVRDQLTDDPLEAIVTGKHLDRVGLRVSIWERHKHATPDTDWNAAPDLELFRTWTIPVPAMDFTQPPPPQPSPFIPTPAPGRPT